MYQKGKKGKAKESRFSQGRLCREQRTCVKAAAPQCGGAGAGRFAGPGAAKVHRKHPVANRPAVGDAVPGTCGDWEPQTPSQCA